MILLTLLLLLLLLPLSLLLLLPGRCPSPLGGSGALGQRLERPKGPGGRDGTAGRVPPPRRIGARPAASAPGGAGHAGGDAGAAVEQGPVRRLLGKNGLERIFVVVVVFVVYVYVAVADIGALDILDAAAVAAVDAILTSSRLGR